VGELYQSKEVIVALGGDYVRLPISCSVSKSQLVKFDCF